MSDEEEQLLLLKNTSFDELKNAAIHTLNDVETKLLEREANKETLDNIVKNYLSNVLFHNYSIDKVLPAIKDQFKREALSGSVSTLIYVGGADYLELTQQNPRRQSALFVHVKDGKLNENGEPGDGGFFETYLWGSTPRRNVTDKFEAGNAYDLKIVEVPSTRQDGTPVTYYNVNDYRFIENRETVLVDILKSIPTLNSLISENLGETTLFDEQYVELLRANASYTFATLKLKVSTIYPHKKGERVLENGKWKNLFKDGSPTLSVIQKNERLDKRYPAFTMTGTSYIGMERNLKISAGFYPQTLGQFFVKSKTLQSLIDSPSFLKETPEHQAQFLSVELTGKKFLVIGKVKGNIDASADRKTLNVSITGVAMIEL